MLAPFFREEIREEILDRGSPYIVPEFCTESPAKGYGITKTLPSLAMPGTHAYPTFNQKGYAEKERTSQTPVNCGFIPPPEDPEK